MRFSHVTMLGFFHKLGEVGESRSKDFWMFEGSLWFHTLAWSVISIFIPILLLSNGFTISEVLFFYIVYHGVNVPMNAFARWLTKEYGPRLVMLIATFFAMLFFLLYASVATWEELIILATLFAIYDSLYYVAAYYIFMGQTKDPENSSENTGILNLVVRSAALVGPIIGSLLVLVSGGNRWVSVSVVICFFIISVIPLFKLTELTTQKPDEFLPPHKFFRSIREIKNHVSLAFYRIAEAIEAFILPMYIYIALHELESIALLAILVPVISIIFSYSAAHIKRNQREVVIIWGSLLLAAVWLLRFAFDNPFFIYVSLVATGLFSLFVLVPLDTNIFRRGAEVGPLTASVYRNSVSMGAKFLLFVVLYFVVDLFHVSFMIAASALILLALTNAIYLIWRRTRVEPQTSVVGLPHNES